MWLLWSALGWAGDVADDLEVVRLASEEIAAAQVASGCRAESLWYPRVGRRPERQAAAISGARWDLLRWIHGPDACGQARPREEAEAALAALRDDPAAADAEIVAWLEGQGQPEAASRWAVLSALSLAEVSGAECSCVGQPAAGTRIVYGYPTQRAIRASRRGRVELGGCVIAADSPAYRCPTGCVSAGLSP